jgi:hypothetical protein
MKRLKLAFTALASLVGIAGALTSATRAEYYYTLTADGGYYELNQSYNPGYCAGTSGNYCVITTHDEVTGSPITMTELIDAGGTGYSQGKKYVYTTLK